MPQLFFWLRYKPTNTSAIESMLSHQIIKLFQRTCVTRHVWTMQQILPWGKPLSVHCVCWLTAGGRRTCPELRLAHWNTSPHPFCSPSPDSLALTTPKHTTSGFSLKTLQWATNSIYMKIYLTNVTQFELHENREAYNIHMFSIFYNKTV